MIARSRRARASSGWWPTAAATPAGPWLPTPGGPGSAPRCSSRVDARPPRWPPMEELGARVVVVAGDRAAAAAAARRRGGPHRGLVRQPRLPAGVRPRGQDPRLRAARAARRSRPGTVVVPAGNGTLVLGLWLGFRELTALVIGPTAPRSSPCSRSAAPPWPAWRPTGPRRRPGSPSPDRPAAARFGPPSWRAGAGGHRQPRRPWNPPVVNWPDWAWPSSRPRPWGGRPWASPAGGSIARPGPRWWLSGAA